VCAQLEKAGSGAKSLKPRLPLSHFVFIQSQSLQQGAPKKKQIESDVYLADGH
jgi:hypothetical protein